MPDERLRPDPSHRRRHVLLNVADEVSDPGLDESEPLRLVLGLGRRDDDQEVLELVEDVAVPEEGLPSVV